MTMDVQHIMDAVDAIRPNGLTTSLKRRWIWEAEGMIQTEIRGAEASSLPPADAVKNGTGALTVPFPYDRLYVWYLCAMVDLVQGDLTLYEMDRACYNEAYSAYAQWYVRRKRT